MSEQTKTHWRKLQDKPYLGRWDFMPGEELLLTIKSVGSGEVYDENTGKTKEKEIIYFEEPYKPMLVNTTNNMTIEKVLGSPFIQDWIGKKIYLRVEHIPPIRKKGEVIDEAIRVINREYKPISCEECGNPITPLQHKTMDWTIQYSLKHTGKKLCPNCMRNWANNHTNQEDNS